MHALVKKHKYEHTHANAHSDIPKMFMHKHALMEMSELSFDPLSLLLTLLFLLIYIYPSLFFMKTTTLLSIIRGVLSLFFQVLSFSQLFICYTYSWSCSYILSIICDVIPQGRNYFVCGKNISL